MNECSSKTSSHDLLPEARANLQILENETRRRVSFFFRPPRTFSLSITSHQHSSIDLAANSLSSSSRLTTEKPSLSRSLDEEETPGPRPRLRRVDMGIARSA